MMFLSLILIVAFEAGFHFVGSRVGVLKTTLSELGNKEILRQQELTSLKKEKRFKDEAAYINPKNKRQINISSTEQKTENSNPANPAKLSIPPLITENPNLSTPPIPPIVKDKIAPKTPEKPTENLSNLSEKKELNRVPTVTETVGTRLLSQDSSARIICEKTAPSYSKRYKF